MVLQFDGVKVKKFKYKSFKELLLKHSNLSVGSQLKELKSVFENWKGNLEQIDDVYVVGVRV